MRRLQALTVPQLYYQMHRPSKQVFLCMYERGSHLVVRTEDTLYYFGVSLSPCCFGRRETSYMPKVRLRLSLATPTGTGGSRLLKVMILLPGGTVRLSLYGFSPSSGLMAIVPIWSPFICTLKVRGLCHVYAVKA